MSLCLLVCVVCVCVCVCVRVCVCVLVHVYAHVLMCGEVKFQNNPPNSLESTAVNHI